MRNVNNINLKKDNGLFNHFKIYYNKCYGHETKELHAHDLGQAYKQCVFELFNICLIS